MSFPAISGASFAESISLLVLVPLVWIFVLLRLYVRGFIVRKLGWDDAAAFVAASVFVLEGAAVLMINRTSSARPQNDSTEHKQVEWFLIAGLAYAASCLFMKFSLGLGYLRVLKFRHLKCHWECIVCYAVIIASVVANLQLFLYLLIHCMSLGYLSHDPTTASSAGHCTGGRGVSSLYVQTTMNVVTDWVLVILPIPSLLAVIMNKRVRISIITILVLGACGSVASIVRLVYLHTIIADHPESGTLGIVMSHVEVGLFIIFGCLMTYHPLLLRYLSKDSEGLSDSASTERSAYYETESSNPDFKSIEYRKSGMAETHFI